MAFVTGIPIRDSIHTDFSTGSGDWNTYRGELTGQFTNNSDRYGEFTNDIREYNRKIDTLTGHWGHTGLFLTPHDAGFRYTGTGDFTASPVPPPSTTTTYSIANGGDDGYAISNSTSSSNVQFNGTLSKNGSIAFAGAQDDEGDIQYFVSFFRFTNVAIDQGATVQSAILKPIKKSSSGSASKDFEIAARDVDNAGEPTSASQLGTRTTARVTLPKSTVFDTTNDNRFDTPDIKTVIQEIVDRAGWSSGNSILLVLYTPTQNKNFPIEARFGTINGSTDESAQLEITV